jgi:hypothetical protein
MPKMRAWLAAVTNTKTRPLRGFSFGCQPEIAQRRVFLLASLALSWPVSAWRGMAGLGVERCGVARRVSASHGFLRTSEPCSGERWPVRAGQVGAGYGMSRHGFYKSRMASLALVRRVGASLGRLWRVDAWEVTARIFMNRQGKSERGWSGQGMACRCAASRGFFQEKRNAKDESRRAGFRF